MIFFPKLPAAEFTCYALGSQRGVSIIAAIFIIVVLGFMGVMFLSISTSGSGAAVNNLQSLRALSIAEGGLQYTLALNRNNMPNYSTNGNWINLGNGQFRVDTPAYVTVPFTANLGTLTVDSTAGFPLTGRLTIGTNFNITYNGTTPNTFQNILPIPHQIHNINDSVYPAAQLANPGLPSACGTVDINVVNDTGGFEIPGIIFIDTEYFFCTAKTALQFQNCQRCYAGSLAAAHPQTRFASQYRITSTGRIGNILSMYAERVVQINAGPFDN